MARDYSQRSSRSKTNKGKGRRPATSRERRPGLPGPVWMIIGLTFGLLIAAYIYIAKPEIQIPEELDLVQVKETREPEKPVEEKALPPEPESRFAFYEMLPNYEIVVPKDPPPASKPNAKKEPPPQIDQPGKYIIQAGSFRSYKDADRRKASMALLGIVSRIEKVTIGADGQTWFRVLVGPNADLNKVNEMRAKLQNNGIDNLLIRVKG